MCVFNNQRLQGNKSVVKSRIKSEIKKKELIYFLQNYKKQQNCNMHFNL